MCGDAWAQNGRRDVDWYELIVAETQEVIWTVEAEFEVGGWIFDGSLGCDDFILIATDSAQACEPVTLNAVLDPGTYWFVVAPGSFYGLRCEQGPQDYTAALTCTPGLRGPSEPKRQGGTFPAHTIGSVPPREGK
jgi:hypothetical protein